MYNRNKNDVIKIINNLLEIFTIRYLKEYVHRNLNLLLISLIVFLIATALGYICSDMILTLMPELALHSTSLIDAIFMSFLEIFPHNLSIDWLVIISGIFLSIISIIITLYNGMLIGYYLVATTPIEFLFGIVPHGIFEIPSSIVALTGAFLITILEIRIIKGLFDKNITIKQTLNNNRYVIKDIIATFYYVFILLLIAGIIESTITPLLLYTVY